MEIGPRARSGSKECEGNESGMALRVLAWTTGRAEFPATWMRKALQRDMFGGERFVLALYTLIWVEGTGRHLGELEFQREVLTEKEI